MWQFQSGVQEKNFSHGVKRRISLSGVQEKNFSHYVTGQDNLQSTLTI